VPSLHQRRLQHRRLARTGDEEHLPCRHCQRGAQPLHIAPALRGHHHEGARRHLRSQVRGVVAGHHALGIGKAPCLGPVRHHRDRQPHARRQRRQRQRQRRIAHHHEPRARQHGVNKQLQRAAAVAGHAELEHVLQLALSALFRRRDANQARSPIGQRLAHRAQHRGLRAAAADPAALDALGTDHGLVAGPRRGRSLHAQHADQAEGLALALQALGMGKDVEAGHGSSGSIDEVGG
jgi:hypothetical protein